MSAASIIGVTPPVARAAAELSRLVSVRELAGLLRRTPGAIRQAAYRGSLPAVRLGGTLLFDVDAVMAAIRPVEPSTRPAATATPSPEGA